MTDPDPSTSTIVVALVANALIALAKAVAPWVTGSTSMLAEAAHSPVDGGNQGLLLLGLRVSARPADAPYPLGHGRAIYFWSFIVALMLFSMGGMFSIYQGIHQWGTGEPLENPWLATREAMLHFLNARSEVAEVLDLITLPNGAFLYSEKL